MGLQFFRNLTSNFAVVMVPITKRLDAASERWNRQRAEEDLQSDDDLNALGRILNAEFFLAAGNYKEAAEQCWNVLDPENYTHLRSNRYAVLFQTMGKIFDAARQAKDCDQWWLNQSVLNLWSFYPKSRPYLTDTMKWICSSPEIDDFTSMRLHHLRNTLPDSSPAPN